MTDALSHLMFWTLFGTCIGGALGCIASIIHEIWESM